MLFFIFRDKSLGQMVNERIQKILARAGVNSLRKSEDLIREGLVTINGKTARLGDKACWGKDAIKVNGKLLQTTKSKNTVYLAFYKPKGVISSLSDPQGRTTITEFLRNVKERVFPVGRLDFNSEGLILLTNDGDFTEKLQKEEQVPRAYLVKVKGFPNSEMLSRLTRGARVGEKKRLVKPFSVQVKETLNSKSWVQIVLLGSGAHDIKALMDTRGFLVEKIVRSSIGHITLRGLKPGHYRYLKSSQVEALFSQPELGIKILEQEYENGQSYLKKELERKQKVPISNPKKGITQSSKMR